MAPSLASLFQEKAGENKHFGSWLAKVEGLVEYRLGVSLQALGVEIADLEAGFTTGNSPAQAYSGYVLPMAEVLGLEERSN